jgi:hypothetical protein
MRSSMMQHVRRVAMGVAVGAYSIAIPLNAIAQTPPAPAPGAAYPTAQTYPQQQQTYPQQPAYPQQQQTYPQQSAYPQQPASPQQATYPQQSTYPQPAGTAYPQQPGSAYPQQTPYSQGAYPQQGMPAAPPPPPAHPIRQLFANTLMMLLNASGASLVSGVAQGLLGAISGWFGRKSGQPPQYAQAYGTSGYGAAPGYTQSYGSTTSAYGTATQTYGSTTSPYGAATQAYGSTSSPYGTSTPAYGTTPSPYGTAAQTYGSTPPAYGTATPTYPSSTSAYGTAAQAYPSTTSPYTTPAQSYPSTTYPGAAAYPNGAAQSYPGAAQVAANPYAASAYPGAATTAGAYGAAAPASPYGAQSYGSVPGVQVYNAQTGQPASAAGTPYQMVASRSLDAILYAGIAYEVHAMAADGSPTIVNPANYIFHTGDRFTVQYRPSMPGHMDVYNVNADGKRTRIDSVTMAAGELATLGPYEFRNKTGDESLRLVLSPCSSPQLLVATRDIVNVGPTASTAGSPAVQLGECKAVTSSDTAVTVRDIAKIAVDDGTAFALDPVSKKELSSGQVTPRQISIVFHHG